MGNGHDLFVTVQKIYEDGQVPDNVSNRLIMAALITERNERMAHDCIVDERVKVNHDAIFGDKITGDGILDRMSQMQRSLERYNRVVWIVIGAVLTGMVGLLFGFL